MIAVEIRWEQKAGLRREAIRLSRTMRPLPVLTNATRPTVFCAVRTILTILAGITRVCPSAGRKHSF